MDVAIRLRRQAGYPFFSIGLTRQLDTIKSRKELLISDEKNECQFWNIIKFRIMTIYSSCCVNNSLVKTLVLPIFSH